MSRFLARLLVRWRWVVITLWVIVGFFAARLAPHAKEALDIRGGTRRPTEAALADALLSERFIAPLGEFFAVTLESPIPFSEPVAGAVLDSLLVTAGSLPWVGGVVSFPSTGDSSFISDDGRATFFVLAIRAPSPDSVGGLVSPTRRALRQRLAEAPLNRRYDMLVTGRAPLDLDVRTVSAEDSVRGELWSLPLTLVVLVLAFGAMVAATLPVIIGFFAITCTLAVIAILAKFTPMSVFVLNMTSMIGLGVGIDYSLLIVTRFREELNKGISRRDAAIRTLLTAGKAVFTSGLTVMVGFAALLATPLIETRSVGIGGLVVVFLAVALSTTFLPPILAVLGREIDRPRWLSRRLAWYHSPRIWEKWARSLHRHPRRALLMGGTAVAILTLPLFWIRIGLPAHNWWPTGTEAGAGVETLSRMGAAGMIQPVRVLIEVPEGERVASARHLRGLRTLSDSLRADPRVGNVRSIVDLRAGASIFTYSVLYSDLDAARSEYPGFVDAYLSGDGRIALMDVIPADTTSLTTTMDLVRDARQLVADSGISALADASIRVGGYAASNVDLQQDLLDRFPLMILLILVTTGLMLAIAFRSFLVPIKAVIMNTLAVSATFGLIVLVFQYGLGSSLFGLNGPTSAIYVVIPVLVFAVVFGLSMDYEVFLLTRIKEAFDKTGKNDQATMEGLSATASVITSAALIMIMVFGVFAFARVLAMQFLGFGLAVAVLLDATLIRMVLVPAFMHLAGEWNWWPGYRRLPPAA